MTFIAVILAFIDKAAYFVAAYLITYPKLILIAPAVLLFVVYLIWRELT